MHWIHLGLVKLRETHCIMFTCFKTSLHVHFSLWVCIFHGVGVNSIYFACFYFATVIFSKLSTWNHACIMYMSIMHLKHVSKIASSICDFREERIRNPKSFGFIGANLCLIEVQLYVHVGRDAIKHMPTRIHKHND